MADVSSGEKTRRMKKRTERFSDTEIILLEVSETINSLQMGL